MTEKEEVLFDRLGRPVYRLCGTVLFDYQGKPRGFIVGKAVYDARGQHRGFWQKSVVWDRMGRVVGFAAEARVDGLKLPEPEIPPVPYRNLPEPEAPACATDRECPALVPAWSLMRLESLLP